MKISVIITTFNEAENIQGVLQSVDWVDEIIVVDSLSTDSTIELAKDFPTKILQRKYSGPADQKNWAIPQASHEWVLILDADERVTNELKNEIVTLLQQSPAKDAYWIPRQSFFMGKKVRYSGWQSDAVIRLIKKEKCRYENVQVHEEISTKNIQVGRLKNKLEHYTYKDIDHFLAKMQRYSVWSAQDHFAKTPRVTFYHLYFIENSIVQEDSIIDILFMELFK